MRHAFAGLITLIALVITIPIGLALGGYGVAPESSPLGVAVTWERDAADGRPATTCWAFRFADGREALKFAAFTEAIEPRGGVIAVHLGRDCAPGEALQ